MKMNPLKIAVSIGKNVACLLVVGGGVDMAQRSDAKAINNLKSLYL